MKNILCVVALGMAALTFGSCDKDGNDKPEIHSVWLNMVSKPVEEITCAYPKQTVCLRGKGFNYLQKVIVNGDEINLNTLFVYESENNITFTIPETVSTTGDYVRVVTGCGMADYPLIVRPLEEQPVIPDFQPALTPGTTSTIYGTNLEGAYEITLPCTYGNSVTVECSYNRNEETGAESVSFTVPEGYDFATGQFVIKMDKYDEARDIAYTEKVYSAVINF